MNAACDGLISILSNVIFCRERKIIRGPALGDARLAQPAWNFRRPQVNQRNHWLTCRLDRESDLGCAGSLPFITCGIIPTAKTSEGGLIENL